MYFYSRLNKILINQQSTRTLKKLYTPIKDIRDDKQGKLLYHLEYIYDNILSRKPDGENRLPNILLQNNKSTKKPISTIKNNKQFISWLERYNFEMEEKNILSEKETLSGSYRNTEMIALRSLLLYIKQVNYDVDLNILFKMCIRFIEIYDLTSKPNQQAQLQEFIKLIKNLEIKLRLNSSNEISIQDIQRIINNDFKQHKTIIESILKILNYKIKSQDQVRVVRSDGVDDQIDIQDGWRLTNGCKSDNDRYLSSLNLLDTTSRKNLKVLSINGGVKTLVIDDMVIRDPKVLKNLLEYLKVSNQSVVIFINGNIKNEALTDISMWNNKNKRQGLNAKCVIIPVKDNDSTVMEHTYLAEDLDFLNFINLPNGQLSILNKYTPINFEELKSAEDFELFLGHLDSIKFTNGESFLYSKSGADKINEMVEKFSSEGFVYPKNLKTTITVKCGGNTLIEMDDKRQELDYMINEYLFSIFHAGGLRTNNLVFLFNKIMGELNKENEFVHAKNYSRMFEDLAVDNKNNKVEVINNLNDYLMSNEDPESLKNGKIEPLSKAVNTLFVVLNFVKLFCSTDVVVTNEFDGKKLAWNILDKKMRNFFD
ncbi:uncharacterized protein HGUI_03488 [Hanseniaspora guilliermondii]|uniref:Mitochondrial chaperone TCM62 n=1 Tax=Hanseniaspora guilliermondii TaxID=56406 RepID=A0A1L0B440_9ASCO|nr:uncharacterized protein HGUI_03488 [Hanseniaspora guilliermondii]